ncbi:SRPBCC domain-containing protein [Sphingomonas sp. SUN039]|uniref:SRPBCC family protein n=1 Tax=Sphingomonas sp. SUN039 TaxID=2937787 RepID=UPI002164DD09|nr:SRPBCC domain-containing protein [Sphingomonas sp. SUN039]UVO54515.1 SRPBCC domain-containing protein [Sphingomonas sp. SUN039]
MRVALLALAALASPAVAEVKSVTDQGFSLETKTVVAASPARVWAQLIQPKLWWQSAHTWSGSAANMALDPRAGGCFCERWKGGEAEHGRVIFVQPGKTLRLSALLGPMQSMPVAAVLTFTLAPKGEGTEVALAFAASGTFGMDPRKLAPGVDGVLSGQLAGLAASLRN